MDLSIVPRFAVIGSPISHSISPIIHRAFSEQTGIALNYEAIELDPLLSVEGLMDFLHSFQAEGGKGLNVTSPFKKLAFQAMDRVSDAAQSAKAINTILLKEGVFEGDNTDLPGWLADWQRLGGVLQAKKVLILGAGGAVSGILGAIVGENPTEIVLINRTVSRAESIVAEWQPKFPGIQWRARSWATEPEACDVVINATTRNVTPDEFKLTNLQIKDAFCYDLNYNRAALTPFLVFSKSQGALKMADGIGMLWAQAAYSFFLWHGVLPRWQELVHETL